MKFAAGVGRVFIGTGEGLSVGVYEDGRLVEIWRAAADDLRTNAAFREAYANEEVDPMDVRERDWISQGLIELPPELPGFTELRVTSDGHLWAKRFVLPSETSNLWGIFTPDGAFLGNIDLPDAMTITEIGVDYVLGVPADDLGVQRVQLHLFRRDDRTDQ